MFTKTVHGRTERERGKFMEIEQTPIGFSRGSSGVRFDLSFLGPFPDHGGYRREGVTVSMTLDEAKAWAARLNEAIRRAELPLVNAADLRLASAPGSVLIADGNEVRFRNDRGVALGLEAGDGFHETFTVRAEPCVGWVLVNANGTTMARIER